MKGAKSLLLTFLGRDFHFQAFACPNAGAG